MKKNCFDDNQIGQAKGKPPGTTVRNIEYIDPVVEERKDGIALNLAATQKPESRRRVKEVDSSDRRKFLKVAGAGLVAASVPSVAAGAQENSQQVFYAHGMVWNPELPGIFRELRLSFDIAVRLGGTGLGTFGDDVHPEFNSHFKINSTARHGNVHTFEGEITSARDPAMIGTPLSIVAEVEGTSTGVTITLGTHTFKGAGLVVIAIIGVLIALLLPA